MKKTLKHFLISIFAILSGVSVAYASFVFSGPGIESKSGEINLSNLTPGWDSLKQKGNTLVSISGGSSQSFALTSLGEVYAWGSDTYGQLGNGSRGAQNSPDDITAQFAGLSPNERIVSINSGMHAFALTSLGKVFGWGYRMNGEVGNGSSQLYVPATSPINITAQFAGLSPNEIVTCIAPGGGHSLAVTSLGKVFSWGSDEYGQLGNGDATTSDVTTPTNITANFTDLGTGEIVTSIVAGGHHSFALTSLGKVFAWGRNAYGQVGNGSTDNITSPLNITSNFLGLSTNELITSISSLVDHSYAVTSLGKVFVWGYGWSVLGDGENHAITGDIRSPKDITYNFPGLSTNEKVISVSAGNRHSLAVTSLGKVFGWGARSNGQVGDGSTFQQVLSPVNITSNFVGLMTNEIVTSVSAAGDSSHAITSLGKFFSWGKDDFGQVGNGSTTGNITRPSNITDEFMWTTTNEKVVSVVTGMMHSAAITSLGKVYTWGNNGDGELGNGGANSSTSLPENITANFAGLGAGEIVTSITAGAGHSFALTSLGKVYAWGSDSHGQLGNGNGTTNVSLPENITANFTDLGAGEIVTFIAAGESHSMALTSLGKVFAWGDAYRGQLGNGSSGSGSLSVETPENITANFTDLETGEIVTSIAAGGHHSFALTSLGKVFAWGDAYRGQLGNGSSGSGSLSVETPENITANFVELATNEIVSPIIGGTTSDFSFFVTSLGKVFSCGNNNYGQLGNGTITDANLPDNITIKFALQ